MKIKKNFVFFWRMFFRIQVVSFILIGAGIIFLTFLTSNNALEIAISGLASVFIGIGVNNFSMMGTHEKDRQKMKAQMLHVSQTLEFIKTRISKLHDVADSRTAEELKWSLVELEEFIAFTIRFMNEEDLLN